jgi:nitrogen-specific signal transduction histidine kinase
LSSGRDEVDVFVDDDFGETMDIEDVEDAAEDLRFRRALDGNKRFEVAEAGVTLWSRIEVVDEGPAIAPTEVSIVRREPFISGARKDGSGGENGVQK